MNMKPKLYITLALLLSSLGVLAQSKVPDTSKRPLVYWSDLIRLQKISNELTRRIHKLDIPALKRDTADMYFGDIAALVPLVYGRTYRDTSKKTTK